MAEYVCCGCGSRLEISPEKETQAWAEARRVFRPEELDRFGAVCDDCWRLMRAVLPDVDARYGEHCL